MSGGDINVEFDMDAVIGKQNLVFLPFDNPGLDESGDIGVNALEIPTDASSQFSDVHGLLPAERLDEFQSLG
jgi:hypothetical protein